MRFSQAQARGVRRGDKNDREDKGVRACGTQPQTDERRGRKSTRGVLRGRCGTVCGNEILPADACKDRGGQERTCGQCRARRAGRDQAVRTAFGHAKREGQTAKRAKNCAVGTRSRTVEIEQRGICRESSAKTYRRRTRESG